MPSYSVHSSDLMSQVAAVLQTSQANFEMRHVDVQHQVRGSDCGLFALAFASSLCSGLDPFACNYNQAQMHSHLLKCFEKLEITPFPSPDHPRKLAHGRFLSMLIVPIYCIRRLAWNKYDKKRSPLVQCSSWYHQSCLMMLSRINHFNFRAISVTLKLIIQLCLCIIIMRSHCIVCSQLFFRRGRLTLKRTLSSSVSGPRGTFYSSVACPGDI